MRGLSASHKGSRFGPVAGGRSQDGHASSRQMASVGEGFETSASVLVSCDIPAWAALAAGGLRQLALPHEATHVLICADNDPTEAGQQAAYDAATRYLTEGRRVRVALPSKTDSDFDIMLLSTEAQTKVG